MPPPQWQPSGGLPSFSCGGRSASSCGTPRPRLGICCGGMCGRDGWQVREREREWNLLYCFNSHPRPTRLCSADLLRRGSWTASSKTSRCVFKRKIRWISARVHIRLLIVQFKTSLLMININRGYRRQELISPCVARVCYACSVIAQRADWYFGKVIVKYSAPTSAGMCCGQEPSWVVRGGSDASQSAFVVPVCGIAYRESERRGGSYILGGF